MIPNIYIAYNIPSQIEIESIEMDVNLHDKRERACLSGIETEKYDSITIIICVSIQFQIKD